MRKRQYIISLIAVAVSTAILSSSCSKFLDVNPKGETFDADMFTSGEGYEDALYGVYNELSYSSNLYGGYLIWFPEEMYGNIIPNGMNERIKNLSSANWEAALVKNALLRIWSDSYEAINHLNNIIQHAEEGGEHEFRHSGLYYGEALALRAMVHFDLVRLFGAPFWAPEQYKSEAIPYVDKYSFDISPILSLDEVYSKIIDDLKRAESMMGEDEDLIPAVRTNSASGFTDARITHLNLYAVRALLARVYWTMGDMTDAAIYAQKVIDSGKFSFRPLSSFVQSDYGTLDLHETIFGFYSIGCQRTNANEYSLTGTTSNTRASYDWKTLYEEGAGSRSDYRLTAWFDSDDRLVKTVNLTTANGGTYSGSSIVGVNILRLPEMYYIMAEYYLDSNPALAAEYFNAVTASRGLSAVSASSLTRDMLFNERRKEMFGEGFSWHEAKKLGMTLTSYSGAVVDGSVPGNYTLPIPDDEYEARNNIEN